MNALVPITNGEAFRASTDAAGLCKEIVLKTATKIQNRRYVTVEGWQAVAIAHGCTASADHVERVTDEGMSGFRATGIVRRMSDGAEISRAEGFLGDDEKMWSNRPVYARRAMVQTRAISRACRSAFAHVIVMLDAGLSTTPAEEVPHEGFDRETGEVIDHEARQPDEPAPRQKLDGPHTSKTALRKAVCDIIGQVRTAETEDALAAIQKTNIETIRQAGRDWPALLSGDPNIAEDVGLKGAVEIRREQLRDGGQLQEAIRSMKETDTGLSLANWMDANEAFLDTLSDGDRRTFDIARELHESNLLTQAMVTAG